MTHILAFLACIFALATMALFFAQVKSYSEGSDELREKSAIIRRGADIFMSTEYKIIAPAVAILAVLFTLFIEATSGLTLLIGALMSSCACVIGMKAATYANVRTAAVANLTRTAEYPIIVARLGGAVAGLAVQSFGLVGFLIVLVLFGSVNPNAVGHGLVLNLECNPSISRLVSYSLGCSVVAMFNRVAGGNYTKAADISADTVAKVRFAKSKIADKFRHVPSDQWTDQLHRVIRDGLPEDSFLNPSVLADFIGDCVNDIAGNCSDLLESFVATISAAFLIANFVCNANNCPAALTPMLNFVIALVGGGLFCCVLSLIVISRHRGSEPSKELNIILYASAGLTALVSFLASVLIFKDCDFTLPGFHAGTFSAFIASLTGVIAGIVIGISTEYYTSTKFRPVRRLAESAKEGVAYVVTHGDAIGERSCLIPAITIGVAIFVSNATCGMFGIAVASLGMLATVAATVTIDAFGPIADNAGGLAETCHLGDDIRAITDELDAFGNTTAAVGKGFAIGSAAFSTVSLIVAFVSGYSAGEPILNAASPIVIVGAIIGGALIEYFSAVLTVNTIDSAEKMADESERQLMEGVLAGTAKPDYDRCIRIAAEEAMRKMTFPSVLALAVPVVFGLLFGPAAVGGLLFGATIDAIQRALFMGNSGGAFDNGKKAIEEGLLPGCEKGSEAHVAAVEGDTIGDTRKDSVGVSLDIFIKMMSTIANLSSSVIATIHVF